MKETKQQRLVKALEARGFRPVKGRSTKYIMFAVKDEYFFVGKNGALRRGKTVADSIPLDTSRLLA